MNSTNRSRIGAPEFRNASASAFSPSALVLPVIRRPYRPGWRPAYRYATRMVGGTRRPRRLSPVVAASRAASQLIKLEQIPPDQRDLAFKLYRTFWFAEWARAVGELRLPGRS